MKKYNGLTRLLALLLLVNPVMGVAESLVSNSTTPSTASTVGHKINASPKSGYEVDGRTSASVLAAKRSHSVSKQDESGWAVFSGLIVIWLVVFFSKWK